MHDAGCRPLVDLAAQPRFEDAVRVMLAAHRTAGRSSLEDPEEREPLLRPNEPDRGVRRDTRCSTRAHDPAAAVPATEGRTQRAADATEPQIHKPSVRTKGSRLDQRRLA